MGSGNSVAQRLLPLHKPAGICFIPCSPPPVGTTCAGKLPEALTKGQQPEPHWRTEEQGAGTEDAGATSDWPLWGSGF